MVDARPVLWVRLILVLIAPVFLGCPFDATPRKLVTPPQDVCSLLAINGADESKEWMPAWHHVNIYARGVNKTDCNL